MSNLRQQFEAAYGPAEPPARRTRAVAAAPPAPKGSPLTQPRLTIMGGLLALALADYLGVRTGIINGTPDGNPVYACAAAVTTVALWLSLPGYTPQQRANTRLERLTWYVALIGLHIVAGSVAWAPVQNPTALSVLNAAGSVLVIALMAVVSVRAWYLRMIPAGRS